MAKKAGYIVIILLLLFGTTGMTINRHFCGRSLIGTSLYSTPDNCCNDSCPGCHNEKISFRISDQFEPGQDQVSFNPGFKIIPDQHLFAVLFSIKSVTQNIFADDLRLDHWAKPCPTKPYYAGNATAVLQVFLF
jgi:hypothetical protein